MFCLDLGCVYCTFGKNYQSCTFGKNSSHVHVKLTFQSLLSIKGGKYFLELIFQAYVKIRVSLIYGIELRYEFIVK